MKKTPINVSPALRKAVGDMRAKALPQLVGLVMRFNEDDRTIRDLWSEGSDQNKHKHNPHLTDRLQIYRRINDNEPAAGERAANKVFDAAGYHAEELFIICWDALLRGAELREDQIGKVDLILSKSPCHGASASSAMKLQGINEYFPIGCASKLASFVTSKDQRIEWRIAFLALAGSDAPDYMPIGGSGVDRLMSARERELADTALRQVEFRDHDAPTRRQQASVHEQRAQTLLAQANELQGKEKGNAFKQAGNAQKRARNIRSEVDQETRELFRNARTTSVVQAQRGIAILDRLPNVDVRRWQF